MYRSRRFIFYNFIRPVISEPPTSSRTLVRTFATASGEHRRSLSFATPPMSFASASGERRRSLSAATPPVPFATASGDHRRSMSAATPPPMPQRWCDAPPTGWNRCYLGVPPPPMLDRREQLPAGAVGGGAQQDIMESLRRKLASLQV